MKKGLSVIICLLILLLFASCVSEKPDNKETGAETGSQNTARESDLQESDPRESSSDYIYEEDEPPVEYEVKKYRLEDGAFEVEGRIGLYKYDELPYAEGVIDMINSYYGIDLRLDEETHYENGYGNWFWNDGREVNPVSASVSMSSKTGKFTFFYMPDVDTILNASQIAAADEEELAKTVADFVKRFEFVTGRLRFSSSAEYNDNSFTVFDETAKKYRVLEAGGRRFTFVSDTFSKQTVSAQEGLTCRVECGDSDITERDTQFFVVTVLNDGTIVSADNYITRAPVIDDGYRNMIDVSDLDKLTSFFTSSEENDTLIIKRIYMDSYNNYFGYPEISPVIKVEYCFESDPKDVQTTEMVMDCFDD